MPLVAWTKIVIAVALLGGCVVNGSRRLSNDPEAIAVQRSRGDYDSAASKSDVFAGVFDDNSRPVKTGALRLMVDPPLCSVGSFSEQHVPGANSVICDQKHQIYPLMQPCGTKITEAECAARAAAVCCKAVGCVAFSLNPSYGHEFCSTTAVNTAGTPGPGWKSWAKAAAASASSSALSDRLATELESQVKTLSSAVSEGKTNKESSKSSVAALRAELAALQAKVSEQEGKDRNTLLEKENAALKAKLADSSAASASAPAPSIASSISSEPNTWTVTKDMNLLFGADVGTKMFPLLGKTDDATNCQELCQKHSGCHAYTWHDEHQGQYAKDCVGRKDGQRLIHSQTETGHTSGHDSSATPLLSETDKLFYPRTLSAINSDTLGENQIENDKLFYHGWGKPSYRLGDAVCNRAYGGPKSGIWNDFAEYYPNSIGTEYHRKTHPKGQLDDWVVLTEIINKRAAGKAKPIANSVVIPLRLGDVIDGTDIQSTTVDMFLKSQQHHWLGKTYIRPMKYFIDLLPQFRDNKINTVYLVYASHIQDLPTYAKSTEYLKKLSAWFEKEGFTVILRLGHNPDDDLVFMSGGPFILNPGTSLYSKIVEHVAQRRNCKIIRLENDTGRVYDGHAPVDDIHQSAAQHANFVEVKLDATIKRRSESKGGRRWGKEVEVGNRHKEMERKGTEYEAVLKNGGPVDEIKEFRKEQETMFNAETEHFHMVLHKREKKDAELVKKRADEDAKELADEAKMTLTPDERKTHADLRNLTTQEILDNAEGEARKIEEKENWLTWGGE